MRKYAILFILLIMILSGCNKENNSLNNNSFTFTDSLQQEVTVNKHPQRTAILFSSFADIWLSAGGSIQITVGESVERNFAEKSVILVDEGSGHSSINTEILIASKPDLIIGTADYECQNEASVFASKHGIPSANFRVETFDDYLKVLEIFCNITERSDLYEINGTSVKNRINSLLTQNENIAQNKKGNHISFFCFDI